MSQSESREGLIDWPDGTDWKCDGCGAMVPDHELEGHGCDEQLERVARAYFWPGGRRDVVVQYACAPGTEEDWPEEGETDLDLLEQEREEQRRSVDDMERWAAE